MSIQPRSYNSTLDKQMRMDSVTSTIENGFVYLPAEADWLETYLHEITIFPKGKHDDQADSTSQVLEWIRRNQHAYGLLECMKNEDEQIRAQQRANMFSRRGL
jgi:phage terminase large subunit-like protein